MSAIPTRIHGALDYIIGLVLIAVPRLFGFADGGPATWAPIVIGVGILLVSMMTDYELGFARLIPMQMHLTFDSAAALLLTASPWLFGFASQAAAPHVAFGVLTISTAFMTSTRATRPAIAAYAARPGGLQ
jgi:hypothetical protein